MSKPSASYDPGVEAGGDLLSLHRNENLFVGRDWTVDAARSLVADAAIATYPDATSRTLREAIGECYGVEPDAVFVGNGADEVLADLLRHLRPSHDAMSVLDVSFKVYPFLAERLGYRLDVLPGETFETGRVDAEGFSGLAVVDSPNGITGRSLDQDELTALAADRRSFLIWDNVYGEYAGDEVPRPLPSNVALVRSFSKFYGLAGLRVGYCIADPGIVAELLSRKDPFNVNSFAQVMAREALRRRDHFRALADAVVDCRAALTDGLTRLGFRVRPSRGIAVLATHPAYAAELIQSELLQRRVAVRRFAADPLASNCIRITVAPRHLQERLLAALTDIIEP